MYRFAMLCAVLLPAATSFAASVYKCTDAEGHIAYQAVPCAAHLSSRVMTLRAPPAAAAAPPVSDSAPSARPSRPARPKPRRPREATATSAPSWQCRISNGEVFYQHSPCPDRVTASAELRDAATRGRRRGAPAALAVSARPLTREEACRLIHAPSASDRAGHERDEDVGTYERNLGRDPCR